MKIFKLISVLLLSATALSLSGCDSTDDEIQIEINDNSSETEEETENFPTSNVYLGSLKGSMGVGLLNLMELEEKEEAYNAYNFTVSDSIDELIKKFSNDEIQIAAIPTNIAAILYNKTNGDVQIAAITSLGNLYILENGNTIKSIKDLSNKTIYAIKDKAVSEDILKYILDKNSVDNIKVEYKEPAELETLMASGEASIGVLSEPYISTAMSKNPNLRIAVNLAENWNDISDSPMTESCIAVRKKYAEKHPRVFGHFLQEYYDSITKLNENTHETAKLAEKFKIISTAQIAEKAIPNFNIVYTDEDEMKTSATNFLAELLSLNPDSIGGAVPGDDFFYTPPKEKFKVKKK